MRSTITHRLLILVVLIAGVAFLLPAAGGARPPESDGSTYTWTGATTLTVDVQPWGAGFVRSTPYLIDCPLACIRPFDPGQTVVLTAYPTSGFTFERWTGACADQPNPCTLETAGAAVDVTAVYAGHYVPPPFAPSLSLSVSGSCPGCGLSAVGRGFHPNSAITVSYTWINPPFGSGVIPDFATTDATGSWSYADPAPDCTPGTPLELHATATDAQGASASAQVTAPCGADT